MRARSRIALDRRSEHVIDALHDREEHEVRDRRVDDGEVWLNGCDIPEYLQANRMNHIPKRSRKLLLHRREIEKLAGRTNERGLTLVPVSIYFKKGMAKVEIFVAKGRKTFDKREAIKKQDAKRDIDRALRRR